MAAPGDTGYAPKQAGAFNKLGMHFNQHAQTWRKKQLAGGFVIDPKLPKDVSTITLSYTFFEVGQNAPAADRVGGTHRRREDLKEAAVSAKGRSCARS